MLIHELQILYICDYTIADRSTNCANSFRFVDISQCLYLLLVNFSLIYYCKCIIIQGCYAVHLLGNFNEFYFI